MAQFRVRSKAKLTLPLVLLTAAVGLASCEDAAPDEGQGSGGAAQENAGAGGDPSPGGLGGEAGGEAGGAPDASGGKGGTGGGQDATGGGMLDSGGGTSTGGAPDGSGGDTANTGGTPGTCPEADFPPESAEVKAQAVVARIQALACDWRRQCCRETCYEPVSLASCEEELAETNNLDLKEAIADGIVIVDGAAFDECIETIRLDATCRSLGKDPGSFFPAELGACSAALKGRDEGDECSTNIECIGLPNSPQCIEGHCRSIPNRGLGESCFRTISISELRGGTWWATPSDWQLGAGQCVLQDGLSCKDGVCVAALGEASACGSGTAMCQDGLTCHEGTCIPLIPTGSPCSEQMCTEGLCLNGVCTSDRATAEFCAGP